LHTDLDVGNKNIKYILAGEGAGTIFAINERTGDIHAMKRLDREEKAEYTLTAQVINRDTNEPLEPPSEFIIKVQDINDNAPEFTHGPYHATVPEMSQSVGYEARRSVTKVTATDADDPVYGNSAKLVYSILEGQPYFSIDPNTAVIKIALHGMDREMREEYLVVIQAKDMGGHMGGLSGTATVTVTLTDVNDNPPKFSKSIYEFSIPEDLGLGKAGGRVKANDRDIGENARSTYSIIDGDEKDIFKITTDPETQEGILLLKKPLDFESKKSYTLKIEAANVGFDPQFSSGSPFRDTATVRVTVEDSDEPPVFSLASYLLQVHENTDVNTIIGQVSAQDPDAAASPISVGVQGDPGEVHTVAEKSCKVPLERGEQVESGHPVLTVGAAGRSSGPPVNTSAGQSRPAQSYTFSGRSDNMLDVMEQRTSSVDRQYSVVEVSAERRSNRCECRRAAQQEGASLLSVAVDSACDEGTMARAASREACLGPPLKDGRAARGAARQPETQEECSPLTTELGQI
ncbi:hypothetical protein Z043_111609, partial [Scleropages formosus]